MGFFVTVMHGYRDSLVYAGRLNGWFDCVSKGVMGGSVNGPLF